MHDPDVRRPHVTRLLALAVIALLTVGSAQSNEARTLVYVMAQQPVHLDPPNIEDAGSPHIAIHVTEPLVMIGGDGALRPHLAESWEANEDATVWTFHLRQGVLFTDGTPFNAAAVKYTFDRAVDPNEPKRARADIDQVRAVEVMDAYTVRFHLKGPYSDLPNLLTQEVMFIVSPTAAEALGADFATSPVGTGPFMVESFVSGESAILVRNPNYWQPMGNVDRIEVLRVAEVSTRAFMLETGEADVVQEPSLDDIAYLDGLDGISVHLNPSVRQYMVSINTLVEPLDDVRVRQALNYAIDKEAIVEHLLAGTGVVNDSPLPPTVAGHVSVGTYPYDPERARELLEEAGYGSGFTLNYWGPTPGRSQANAEIGQQIQAWLGDIGIEVEISTADGAANVERITLPPEGSEAAGKNLMFLGGPAPQGAQVFFEQFFTTQSWAPAGGNRGFYSNSRIDELVQRTGAIADPVERQTLFEEIQTLLMEDAPWIFLHTISHIWGVNDRVTGLEFMPNDLVLFTHARID